MGEYKAEIEAVVPGSLADQLGVQSGGVLQSINGQPVGDILNYRLALASEQIRLCWMSTDGQITECTAPKEYGQDLGIIFSEPTIDPVKPCRNNCQFCFIRQLPEGLRSTLNLRDDDYRLSALQGSFITLTNLSETDWQRVLELRLSPLYVSVHTTNGSLRAQLLQNPVASKIMEQLRILSERRIELHCQIVLLPGQNDGKELEKTVNDLLSLWPAVQSVAVVPVGLTGHRDRLPKLRLPTSVEARQVIDFLLPLGRELQRKLGVSFAYLADEWFVLAGSIVPERRYYDDFPQIENGIGLLRRLLDDALPALRRLPRRLSNPQRVFWVTGRSAANALQRLAERLNQVEGLWVDVLPVTNSLFGESVTVTGLVAGTDIIKALHQVETDGVTFLIPDVMIRPLEQDFLDDVTFAELKEAFPKAKVVLTPTNGHALVQYTIGEEVDQCR